MNAADESIHGLAVEIPTNHREIPGSTPGRYNLQVKITSIPTNHREIPGSTPGDIISRLRLHQQGRAGGEGTGYRGDNICQKKSRGTVQPRSRVFLRKSFLGQATGWGRNQ